MQMIFKAITGSSGHAFWWERTVLHSMETVVGRWSGSLGKYQSRKRYLLPYAKVPYVTQQRELPKAVTSSVAFVTDSSLACTVPHYPSHQGGVTGTSCYRSEYDLDLIKIPSHLDRESIYRKISRYILVCPLYKSCPIFGVSMLHSDEYSAAFLQPTVLQNQEHASNLKFATVVCNFTSANFWKMSRNSVSELFRQ